MKELQRVLIKHAKIWMNMLNRSWICLNMSELNSQGSECMYYTIHSSRSPYKLMSSYWEIFRLRDVFRSRMHLWRVLDIPGFWVCHASAYLSITQGPKYAWIWLNNAPWQGFEYAWSAFHSVKNKLWVLDMSGLRI